MASRGGKGGRRERRGRKPSRAGRLVRLVAVLLAGLASGGCVYSTHVTNERVRDLEASRIVVGETTLLDVLETWGPPSPTDPLGLLNPASPGLFRSGAGVLRYVSREVRCTSFLATGPLPNTPVSMAPRLPFLWCDDQPTHVLLLEFDTAGRVKRVSKGSTEVVWRPWSRGASRRTRLETTAVPGTSLP